MKKTSLNSCIVCQGKRFHSVFTYAAPPVGEIKFSFSDKGEYRREILCCETCGLYVSVHDMDMSNLYSEDYVSSTYGNGGIEKTFQRIINLDPSRSDNVGRVQRINEFIFSQDRQPGTLLDVGSGLCVFPHRMKQTGWTCTALDPDERAVEHARTTVGVTGVCADFKEAHDLGRFDLVTLNKVLEHIEEPVGMLAKARNYLKSQGLVYIELPDGERAAEHGQGREEFFIDHHYIFSASSLCLLAQKAGFMVELVERIHEPSSKYTLYAFLSAR